ncbi:ABC transporter permease [Cytobacillus sp. Hz8]|uniref:ABC transporter permease n=1 Tax=Cytobacillus sp. Hz8 TaxID=3347168 RepID=UPI0035D890D3
MLLRILVIFILCLMILPILIIIPLSFSSSVAFEFPPPSFSLKWYQAFLANNQWTDGFIRSIIVAVLTAILSMVIGTMASMAIDRLRFPGKNLFMNLMIAPMVIPLVIVGIAMYYTFSVYQMTNSITALVLAHSIIAIPTVVVTVTAKLKGMDRNLELAALSLGSNPIGVFFKITFPLIRSAIIAGTLFAFITSLDEVVVSIFIAGATTKTLPVVMWENMRTQVDPTIAAVSSILIISTLVVIIIQAVITKISEKKQAEA